MRASVPVGFGRLERANIYTTVYILKMSICTRTCINTQSYVLTHEHMQSPHMCNTV